MEKEELLKKIEELEKRKKEIAKELQSPFLNINLRTKYKKELPEIEKSIAEFKRRILLSNE